MASSKIKQKDIKKKVIEEKSIQKKKISSIKIKDIKKIIERKQIELQRNKDFKKKLQITIETEQIKISELEGAIIALHELATGEKVH